jgi:DNA-binding PadR family transcriptional regulator
MPSTEMTDAEHAILSLVAEKPAYGYEIEQIIEIRGMREWTAIGFSSIYYQLRKMEEKGWIISKITSSKNQGLKRKIYSITNNGLDRCRQTTIQALSEPHPIPNPFLTSLSNLPLLNYNQINSALEKYRNSLELKIIELKSKKKRQGSVQPMHVDAIFDHSIHLLASEITWIDKFLSELSISEQRSN